MSDENNNVKNNDNIEDVFTLFENNPIYDARRAARDKEDVQRANFAQIVERASRDKNIYGSYANPQNVQRTVSKSIGPSKQTKANVNRKKIAIDIRHSPLFNKVCIGLCALTVAVSLGVGSYAIFGDDIAEGVKAKQEMDRSVDVLKTKAMFNLFYNDLAGMNADTGEFVVGDNAISDYSKLDISNPVDIYTYRLILPASEFEKFIQSVTYNNGLSNYVSTEQFLRINGYFDKNYGTPSFDVFANYMENKIKEIVPELLDDYANNNGIFTYGDLVDGSGTKGMGGK